MPKCQGDPRVLRHAFAVCDVFRVLFCAFVILGHAAIFYGARFPPAVWLRVVQQPFGGFVVQSAGHGVWGLFVLSGFFFALKTTTTTNLWLRVRNRLLRLYPLYALSQVAFLIGVRFLSLEWPTKGTDLLRVLSLGSNLGSYQDAPNVVGWTVCVDFQLHLLGLLLCGSGARPRQHRHFAALWALAVAARWVSYDGTASVMRAGPLAYHAWNVFPPESEPFIKTLPGFQGPYVHDPQAHANMTHWVNHNWVSTRTSLPPFVLGWWLGWVLAEEARPKCPAPSLTWLLKWPLRIVVPVLYFSAMLSSPEEPTEHVLRLETPIMVLAPPVLSTVFTVLLYQLFWAHETLFRLLPCGRLVPMLSRMSYAAYLMQIPVIVVVLRFLPLHSASVWGVYVYAACCFAAVQPFAAAAHRIIEEPFISLYGGGR